MGYSEFNPKLNILDVVVGSKNPSDELTFRKIDKQENFSFILNKSETIGVRVDRFLSKVELKGYRAENLFKDLLNQVSIPYLHIGQSPGDHSRILQDIRSKRPDFLVNIPQLGILLFDVKCRRKMGFDDSEKKYFQINKEEIERLYELQHKLLLPVWIAFLDEALIYKIHDSVKSKCDFHLASLTDLNSFLLKLKENLTEKEYSKISSIRVPNELLSIFSGELNLKFGGNKISDTIMKEFSDGYKFILDKVEKQIIYNVKNKKIYKTYLKDEVRSRYMLMNEIDHLLTILIKDKIISYKPKEYLTIKV